MAVANVLDKMQIGGVSVPAITAQSNDAADAICSATLTGITSSQLIGLTQMIVTSTGATAAACVSLQLSGLTTSQIAGGVVSTVFGVPAGAGVPATPHIVNFNPPLFSQPGGTIRAQMGALGSGHVSAKIVLNGKVVPRPSGA